MARCNANVDYDHENSMPLDQPDVASRKEEMTADQAVHNMEPLVCLQASAEYEILTPARRGSENQKATASVQQSAPLAATTESSRPLGTCEVIGDSVSCEDARPCPTVDTRVARLPSPLILACVTAPATSENATPASISPGDGITCEETTNAASVGQDTSLRTVDILRYSDFRELESDLKYTQDIHYYLRKQELEYRPRPDYMQGQPDITSSMRTVLVDWLVEVAIGLHAETLFRAVAYVDRFLSTRPVPRRKLQLLGTASLFISCKFEEIYPPKVEEFAYITDGTCTEEQVVRMEEEVLKVLSFDMASPTINYFVQCYAQVDEAPAKVRDLAQYLCELALLDDVPYLEYLPSIIAGASLCLASHTLGRRPWGRELVEFSGYDVTDIRECICSLYSGWCTAPTRAQRAVHGKFKGVKFNQVADLEPSPTLPF